MPLNTRKCAYCGKEFQPKSNRNIYCKGPHYMNCPVCNKQYLVTNNDKLKNPPTACSYQCRTVLRTQTSLKKYGCTAPGNNPEARQKASKTMMKNLGVPYAMMSEKVQEKSKKTLIERYGVDNIGKNEEIRNKRMETERKNHGGVLAFNTPESYDKRRKTILERYEAEIWSIPQFRDKCKQTMLQKYGAEHMMQVSELKQKQQESIFNHYGVKSAFKSPEIREKCKQTMLKRYGVENAAYSEELMKKAEQTMLERYGKSKRQSKINEQFSNILDNYDISHSMEYFLDRRWFDIKIENENILIEIDPTYTHNCIGNHWGPGLDINYHKMKTQIANNHNFRCIHIWDWDDSEKIARMLVPIKHKIYARNCKLFVLYQDYAQEFLNQYCIYPVDNHKKLHLGLVYQNELIQIMSFREYKGSKKYDYELVHLCTKPEYQIIGGASKLFHFATHEYEMNNIIAFCDLSKFTGNVFAKIGMWKIKNIPPIKYWSIDDIFIPDSIIDNKFIFETFGIQINSKSEIENIMMNSPWIPIYDCGHDVYIWKR